MRERDEKRGRVTPKGRSAPLPCTHDRGCQTAENTPTTTEKRAGNPSERAAWTEPEFKLLESEPGVGLPGSGTPRARREQRPVRGPEVPLTPAARAVRGPARAPHGEARAPPTGRRRQRPPPRARLVAFCCGGARSARLMGGRGRGGGAGAAPRRSGSAWRLRAAARGRLPQGCGVKRAGAVTGTAETTELPPSTEPFQQARCLCCPGDPQTSSIIIHDSVKETAQVRW